MIATSIAIENQLQFLVAESISVRFILPELIVVCVWSSVIGFNKLQACEVPNTAITNPNTNAVRTTIIRELLSFLRPMTLPPMINGSLD